MNDPTPETCPVCGTTPLDPGETHCSACTRVAEEFRMQLGPAPDDVVGPHPIDPAVDREFLLQLDHFARTIKQVSMHLPGEPIENNRGDLIGMTEPKVLSGFAAPPIVERPRLERAGLTPADVPHLVIVDLREE